MTPPAQDATPLTDAYYETYDAWQAYAAKHPNMPPEIAESCPIDQSPDDFARTLERANRALQAEVARLTEERDWFVRELTEREDVRDGDDGPLPNEAMSMLIEFRRKFS